MTKDNVKKLHFLIHPGFLSYEVPKSEDVPGVKDPYKERMVEYIGLLDKYVTEAKKLPEDEIMFAFVHTDSKQFKEDMKTSQLYAEKMRELRSVLGRRLIVLSGDNDVVFDDSVMERAKEIANKRGFYFDNKVLSEAYGEMLSVCVERGADRLNENAGFENKTK